MADLTTTPNGIWILQALLGVEKMPTALRLRPFIPSVDGDGTVATELGDVPWAQTAEYQAHVASGVIGADGRVDDAVRDWMAVVGRPQREVLVVIRRPAPLTEPVPAGEEPPAFIEERVMCICQRERWLAMIARSGDEVVLAPLGEAARSDEQIDLICDTLLHAFSRGDAAAISGFNVPSATFESTLKEFAPQGRQVLAAALARLGLSPDQVAVLSAACHLDESAMAVVSVIDHGIEKTFHPDVLSVIDSEFGRITVSYTTGPDGSRWTSIWPTSVEALRQDISKLLKSAKAPAATAAR
jgi:hypothetical protein